MSEIIIVKESKKTEKLAKISGHGMQEIVVKKKSKSYKEHLNDLEEFFTRNPDDCMQDMFIEPDLYKRKATNKGEKLLTKGVK